MNIAILLSGGMGLRMGMDVPKQYVRVSGKMLITYCLETLLMHPMLDAVQIVAENEWREEILTEAEKNGFNVKGIYGFSTPGTERQSSIFNALKDLKASAFGRDSDDGNRTICHTVFIHDAVRPNLSEEQINACFDALEGHDGVMPVLPMKDTVYLSDSGACISKLLDREKVFAGQAPEVFDFDKYYAANLRLTSDGFSRIKGSTEPAVMAGMDIVMIPGDENNYKITTKEDLKRFRRQKEEDR